MYVLNLIKITFKITQFFHVPANWGKLGKIVGWVRLRAAGA